MDKIKVLLLDPSPNIRNTISSTLKNLWFDISVHTSPDVGDAVNKVKNNVYDIIVSEYDLWKSARTGQQFLEQIRIDLKIPWSTGFIMTTTERYRSKVLSALEYWPDEYLLKPFKASDISDRLMRVIDKKNYFEWVYNAIYEQNYQDALRECEKLKKSNKYPMDTIRLQLLCYLKLEDYESIKKLYHDISQNTSVEVISKFVWLRYAYSKALFHLWQYSQAEEVSRQIKEENPNFLENYKLLADILHAERKDEDSIFILKEAVALSPLNMERQKKLWEVALLSGDYDTSRASLEALLNHGKNSIVHTIDDYANLAHIESQLWNYDEALKILGDGFETFQKEPSTKLVTAVMESQVFAKKWDMESSKSAFQVALDEYKNNPDLSISPTTQLYFGAECLEHGELDLWKKMISEGIKDGERKDAVEKHLKRTLRGEETLKQFDTYIQNLSHDGQTVYESAMEKVKSWDWKKAISLLRQQALNEPNNPTSYYDLSKFSFVYIEKKLEQIYDNDIEFDKLFFEAEDFLKKANTLVPWENQEKYQKEQMIIKLIMQRVLKKRREIKEKKRKLTPDLKTGDEGLDDILPDVML